MATGLCAFLHDSGNASSSNSAKRHFFAAATAFLRVVHLDLAHSSGDALRAWESSYGLISTPSLCMLSTIVLYAIFTPNFFTACL